MSIEFSQKLLTSNRIALQLEYCGSAYHGWQIQKKPAVATIQGKVEQALSQVANQPVTTICAGRTDARVHATAQLVHFETSSVRSEKAWVCGVNANLADDIVIKSASAVPDDFHARFSATARTYRYIIANQNTRTAVLDKKVTLVQRSLNTEWMQEAAEYLLGEMDFSAFRGSGCQSNSPFRFVEYIQVSRQAGLIVTEIKANAFLLHMVRNIMGVLIEIGLGDKPVIWAKQVLESRDRKQAGKTASPYGLYLVKAHYPEGCKIPELPYGPLFLG